MDNLKLIENSIKELEAMRGDDEAAHSFEDKLYIAVLQDIANGVYNPQDLATTVLKAQDVKFERWCA